MDESSPVDPGASGVEGLPLRQSLDRQDLMELACRLLVAAVFLVGGVVVVVTPTRPASFLTSGEALVMQFVVASLGFSCGITLLAETIARYTERYQVDRSTGLLGRVYTVRTLSAVSTAFWIGTILARLPSNGGM